VKTFSDPQPKHWQDYGRFQQVKHELIRRYLEGWFPKLAFWSGRVLYLDTHAGRGSYVGARPGSPLVALRTLLDHAARDRLLENSECRFLFIERDRANAEALTGQVGGFGRLPGGIDVRVKCGDAFEILRAEVDALKKAGQGMAPAFIFVDPYGFSLPGDLLAELMAFERVELFVNVMWRELDMAMSQEPEAGHGQAAILDQLLGPDSWRRIDGDTMVERADQAAALLADRVGARWWTHVRMVSGGGAVRFFLLHLTNHDAGRDLMKECVWKVCPGGDMMVRRSDNPVQFFLIEEEPDLAPLREWLLHRLQDGAVADDILRQELRGMIWTWGHLRGVESELKSRGQIERRRGLLSVHKQQSLFRG
jgi:three-Cys-motif partner protein